MIPSSKVVAKLSPFQLATVALGPGIMARAAEHPPLVDLATTQCTYCHDDLLDPFASVHAPAVEDCTTCHEVEISGGETSVEPLMAEPDLCLLCHDELSRAVAAELEAPHFPVTDACLSCHDPHGSGEARLLRAAPAALCLDCHDSADLQVSHGGQLTASTRCAACHDPHGSDHPRMLLAAGAHQPFSDGSCDSCHRPPFGDRMRLRARGERLCAACHGDLTAPGAGAGSVHAALIGARGRAGCLSCHDPHMSDQPALLVAEGNRLCAACHGEVVRAAAAETGHAPADDDCLTCHQPHASAQARLLIGPRPELCALCHDTDDPELAAAHLGAEVGALDCVSCHSPHGAGHPALLARNLHFPVLDGCDTCHEGAYDKLMEGGGSELCLVCHDDVGDAAAAAAVPHGALELGTCVDCHNPHASPQQALLKQPGGGACADCHDEQLAGEGEVAHGVIEVVGCHACHEPHGGSEEKLLRLTGSELCLSCHASGGARLERGEPGADGTATVLWLGRFEIPAELGAKVASLSLSADETRDHPVTNHPVSGEFTAGRGHARRRGSSFEGRLDCRTCHDPHKGRSSTILRWDAGSGDQACVHCHEEKQ